MVESRDTGQDVKMDSVLGAAMRQPPRGVTGLNAAADTAAAPAVGTGKAFIGGGCCVQISVEYAPVTPTAVRS